MSPDTRIGYVLKVYPRFSETFVVSEILAREARGQQIEIFSLRPPADPRFHEMLARVQAPVHYVGRARKVTDLWDILREAAQVVAPSPDVLGELLRADVSDAAQALHLATLARRQGITHFHAHFASVSATVARLASLLTGIPYSFTAHAKDIFHESVVPADVAAKLRDAHHVVTISDYNADFLRRNYADALTGTPLHRIYNGLDLESFTAPALSRARAEEPGGTGDPLVLGVGRLVEKKGFDILIDAVGLLHRAGRTVRCRIVGDGDQRDSLQARITRAGLDDLVTLTGPLPQQNVRAELGRADVFAAPCVVGSDGNADGLPTVLLEAMALGVPSVSTDVTGIAEAIHHEITGLRVNQHDAGQLAAAIERLLDDAQLRLDVTAAARDLVERRFDSRVQARRLDEALTGAADAVDHSLAGMPSTAQEVSAR